jgi:hypothetical protein
MTQAVPRHSSLLALLFGFATRVDRRIYVISGVLLMLAKYSLDAMVAWAITGEWWSPWRYLSPVWSVPMAQFPHAPSALLVGLGLMTLPFFWIGVSMSVRRAADGRVAAACRPCLCNSRRQLFRDARSVARCIVACGDMVGKRRAA